MLVGNKSDLDHQRVIQANEVQELLEKERFFFIETSTLESTNAKKAFQRILMEMFPLTTMYHT